MADLKEKLEELQATLKEWVAKEKKRVETEVEWLENLKASEAIAPISDQVSILEAEIDIDLANLLDE